MKTGAGAQVWCSVGGARLLWTRASRRLLAYAGVAVVVAGLYLLTLQLQVGAFGLPLDDAWIHQVYARNLATRGEFAFFPGRPSAGSTSPLWAILLAVGYVLPLGGSAFAVALGVIALAGSAALAARLARRFGVRAWVADWVVPLFVLLEWHVAWASVSGMEITLFVLLSLALIEAWLADMGGLALGLLGGLLTLTRPEGIGLAGLLAFGMIVGRWGRGGAKAPSEWSASLGQIAKRLALYLAGMMLMLAPYVAFNLATSGTLLPNTFYAKSQEYAAEFSRGGWLVRWAALYRQPLLGGQLVLAPGIVYAGWRLARQRKLELLIPLGWVALLPALYAARLPVVYQYGRYEMPIIPFVGLYGIVGTGWLLERIPVRVVRRAWALSAAVLVVAFTWLGAQEFARSVAIVNCEMAATAHWTATQLPPNALIAAHDIGAQGYFDSHPLLDLAGLVSPEVILFIRDEARLAAWMQARGAQYAIFFPDWYPRLAHDPRFVPIHSENCPISHATGEVDLTVYRLNW